MAIFACSAILLNLFPTASSSSALYRVNNVYDGDTITLDNGTKIRLLQIDTPELSSSECYGQEAKQALIQLIGKSKVTLKSDKVSDDKDRYGRFLRYIFIGKKNINLELVKIGAAAPYFYQGERGRYSKQLLKAAKIAKVNGIGLWKFCPGTKLQTSNAVSTKFTLDMVEIPSSKSVGSKCDPNYQGCIPPFPPDLDCGDIKKMGLAPIRVIGEDIHKFDGDGNGIGCD